MAGCWVWVIRPQATHSGSRAVHAARAMHGSAPHTGGVESSAHLPLATLPHSMPTTRWHIRHPRACIAPDHTTPVEGSRTSGLCSCWVKASLLTLNTPVRGSRYCPSGRFPMRCRGTWGWAACESAVHVQCAIGVPAESLAKCSLCSMPCGAMR